MLTGAGGNIGVSVGSDGIVIVDDQYAPLAPKIQAALKSISDKPLRFVLNTHYHGDHTGGNETFGTGGAIIVAQDNVRKRLSTEQVMAAFHNTVPASPPRALPVVTFLDEMTFFLNNEELHVIHVEHAHTDGDSLIHFKNANIVHTGDTYFSGGYPFIDIGSGGSIEGYIAAAARILSLCDDRTQIIPGHGPLSNKAGFVEWRDMLTKVRDRVAKLKAGKKTLEQVVAAKPSAELDARWGGAFIKPDFFVTTVYQTVGTFEAARR